MILGLILSSQNIVAQVPSYVPTNGLVGYWPFNGNANDESGNGNNGVPNNIIYDIDRFGNSNSSLNINGNTNSWVDVSISDLSLVNQQTKTFSFWIKLPLSYTGISYYNHIITNKSTLTTLTLPYMQVYGNYPSYISGGYANKFGFSGQSPVSSQLFNDNLWHNIIVVCTNTFNMNLYVDGIYLGTQQFPNISDFTTLNGFRIGNNNGNLSQCAFAGHIDDIGIWNRALTQQEITNLFNGNPNAICNIPQGTLANGMVAYYPFCGNANDTSGNGNNGTVTGATLTADRYGNANSAYSFDGVSNFIQVANSSNLSNFNSVSISGWFNSSSQSGEQGLVTKWYQFQNCSSNTDNYTCILANNQYTNFTQSICGATNNYVGYQLQSALTVPSGTWNHFVFIHDNINGGKIYINGVLIVQISTQGTICSSTNPLIIGADNANSIINRFFSGKLDDIGIWNRVLTQQEINVLYNGNSIPLCWSDISTGLSHSGAIKPDGTLWTWGKNDYGELGYTSTTNINNPAQVGIDTNWLKVVCASHDTYGIKTDGTLWAWGNNNDGQLGNGTYNNSSLPIQIGTDNHWKNVSAFQDFAMGLKTDGTIWSWGFNIFGMLGDGTNIERSSPVQIGIDSNWKTISAGAGFSFAIKTDGTLWNWGYILSSNGSTNYLPMQVGTDNNWKDISAGGVHVIGLKNDNSLWAWGKNSHGQLGDNTTIDNIVPTNVLIGTTWKSISACGFYSMAIKSDGTLWSWGANNNYQLGDGTQIEYHIPHQIGVYNDWTKVLGFNVTSYGLRNNEVWNWGSNAITEIIGDGTPVQLSCDNLFNIENFMSKNEITIYPNPANSKFTINCGNQTDLIGSEITITNTLGQEIYKSILSEQIQDISLSSIAISGIYFVTIIHNSDKTITTKKIVLQ